MTDEDERRPMLPPRANERTLSWGQIICYAMPSFALTCVYGSPYHVFINKYYLDTLMVRPMHISLGTALARAVDAVTTPYVAWLMDRGRRRVPCIIPSALAGCICLFYLFDVRRLA